MNEINRIFLTLFVVFYATTYAYAENLSDPLPRYERAGAGFGCHTNKADFEKSKAEKRDVCLQIGPLFVGMQQGDAEAVLGRPVTTVNLGSRKAFAYPLQYASGKMTSYAVLTYAADGRADSVQITGAPSGGWQFCGLSLGSTEDAVISRLGAPLQSEKSDDPGALTWSYRPWTFSFEIKAGVVSSIRVAAE